jgi:hypothetical protein
MSRLSPGYVPMAEILCPAGTLARAHKEKPAYVPAYVPVVMSRLMSRPTNSVDIDVRGAYGACRWRCAPQKAGCADAAPALKKCAGLIDCSVDNYPAALGARRDSFDGRCL